MERTKPPNNKSKSTPGPKSECTPKVVEEAFRLCLLGCTNQQMAEWFDKDKTTISHWYKTKPRFRQAVDQGRMHADGKVAEALYNTALGYEHDAIKFFKIPVVEKEYDEDGNVISERRYSEIKKVPYRKKYKPDTKAIIKFLGVRNRATWGEADKVQHEHKHLLAGEVNIHHLMDQIQDSAEFTDEELQALARLGLEEEARQLTNGQKN